jgi:hypothetical protein
MPTVDLQVEVAPVSTGSRGAKVSIISAVNFVYRYGRASQKE